LRTTSIVATASGVTQAAFAQRDDIRSASNLLHSVEAMRQVADAAIAAMVSRHGSQDGARGFKSEDAARRNRQQSSFNAAYTGWNGADKRDSNRRYREPQQNVQVDVPAL
jgi:hypothetical protein